MKSARNRGHSSHRKEAKAALQSQVQATAAPPTQQSSPSESSVPSYMQCWTPQASTALKLLVSARFCAALLSNISDCDETYNYWEPTHYVIYGRGFQTWEYSPAFAIRSYFYIFLHVLPGKLHRQLMDANRILVFYFIRCVLGLACAICELYFYRGVCKNFGATVGRLTLFFSILSTGMFISSAAYLPSSFSMYMTMLSMAGWYLDNIPVAVVATAVSALVGWPFAGAIGIPIALDLVFRKKKIIPFIKWSVISLIFILVPQVLLDSYYYGKTVIAPLNIVLYNVFSEHGPDLYGVEPWTFYFMNGFLNFNLVFPLALTSILFVISVTTFLKGRAFAGTENLPHWLTLMPMYIWILIFFSQGHKEERFLFPIYPLICLAASVSISNIQKLYHKMFTSHLNQHYSWSSNWLVGCVAVVFALVSLSRSGALFFGYHTPLDLYPNLYAISEDKEIHTLPADKTINVCIGKEWYRFPSSFFLPNNWRLQFIQSEFKGQLPKPYSSEENATQIIPTHMNDLNLEETSRYIDVSKCHYLIDYDSPQVTKREPRYSELTEEWEVLVSLPFLDTQRSHRFFRAFYVPFISQHFNTYENYSIMKTKRRKASSPGKKKSAPSTIKDNADH